MSDDLYFKLPRLYSAESLKGKETLSLAAEPAHYLKNVLRAKQGDKIRFFDGKNGEWLGRIESISKKEVSVALEKQIAEQPAGTQKIALYFTPIKKQRQDILIEKAVELGVTDFYPYLSQNTDIRKINGDRLTAQIKEAAEQCERFDIPRLHDLQNFDEILVSDENIYACIERFENAQNVRDKKPAGDFGVLIGPEGGFADSEKEKLAQKFQAVDLGDTVLRCETAAIKALILLSA